MMQCLHGPNKRKLTNGANRPTSILSPFGFLNYICARKLNSFFIFSSPDQVCGQRPGAAEEMRAEAQLLRSLCHSCLAPAHRHLGGLERMCYIIWNELPVIFIYNIVCDIARNNIITYNFDFSKCVQNDIWNYFVILPKIISSIDLKCWLCRILQTDHRILLAVGAFNVPWVPGPLRLNYESPRRFWWRQICLLCHGPKTTRPLGWTHGRKKLRFGISWMINDDKFRLANRIQQDLFTCISMKSRTWRLQCQT